METLALYALKSGACLALFYLFFKQLLSRETLHRFNRLLLHAALLLAFVLPFCVITIEREVPAPAAPAEGLPFAQLLDAAIPAESAAEPFDWGALLGGIYLAGVAAMLLATLVAMLRVLRLVRSGRRETLPDGWTLVRIPQATTPFSWWRYVVVSEEEPAEGFEQIRIHETAHLRLHHSLDLLITDLAGCVQWFNPAMWLLRRELRAIHEYEADEAVLESGADARQYQIMLIKKAAGRRWYSIANSFNHSNLKNRITMMLQKRSSRWARAKALAAVPLVCMALGAFARTVDVPVEDKSTKNSGYTADLHEKSGHEVTICVYVVDKAGEALPGAILQETGTMRGTVADLQGRAELTIDDASSVDLLLVGYETLNLSYRNGMTTLRNRGAMQTIRTTADRAEMRVTMVREEEPLFSNPMLAAAERSSSGAVAASRSDRQSEETLHDRVEVHQGPAVDRTDPAQAPLYLLDGEPVEDIRSIDPQTIASVEVLKDDASTQPYLAQYGDRARNGVVLVHRKAMDVRVVRIGSMPKEEAAVKVLHAGTADRTDAEKPLILLDGEPVETMENIDPDTIESITVLKSPEAIQPYLGYAGDRACNGVILIKLKEGGQPVGRLHMQAGQPQTTGPVFYRIDGREATDDEVKALENERIAGMNVNKQLQADGSVLETVIDITTKQ